MKYVTLLSDMGSCDISIARVKARLMESNADITIADLSHSVNHYDLQQAAYLLLSSYRHFPPGSIHVVLVDVFYTKEPLLILYEKDGHYFVAPDNGLLSLMFGNTGDVKLCYGALPADDFSDWLKQVSNMIGTISNDPQKTDLLPRIEGRYVKWNNKPCASGDALECRVIHVDNYGNVILNIKKYDLLMIAGKEPLRINIAKGDDIREIRSSYKEVDKGQVMCRFNKAGYLEIGVKYGRASDLFGLKVSNNGLQNATVRIFFGSTENETNPRIAEFFESMEGVMKE